MTRVWYFAYGANMQGATFRGRRGIEPRSARAGRLRGWELVLDKPPLLPMGQSFANLVPDGGGLVWGVLYELTAEDWAHVEVSEAVPLGNYAAVEVEVEVVAPAPWTVRARTLVSRRRAPAMRPSTRYLHLMIEGAEEHGLPAEWVERLRRVPAQEESDGDVRMRALLDGAMGKKKPR